MTPLSPGNCSTRYLPKMHELAVSQALLAEVAAVARSRNAIAVTDIHVGIGIGVQRSAEAPPGSVVSLCEIFKPNRQR